MAFITLSFVGLIAMYVCGVIPRNELGNFPLNSCSRDQMDVLFLYFDSRNERERNYQWSIGKQLIKDLLSFSSIKLTSRVMFADVIDKFSSLDPNVNVSSWSFHSTPGSDPHGRDDQQAKRQQYKNVEETILLKLQFVQRLFSEMSGVRENIIHIAVIFLNGASFSYEESRSVPHILQQQYTYIKVFVVVMGGKYVGNTVYMRDTLIVGQTTYYNSKHILTLAICNQCIDGWFMFERNESKHSLSCYKLLVSNISVNWKQAYNACIGQGVYLAIIGTKYELNYLQTKMYSYFKELRNHNCHIEQSSQFSAYVYIGLQRDSTSPAKRFHWLMSNPPRPLVINNWMPGKPSEGSSSGCGVWKFVSNDHCNDNGSSRNDAQFVNGWVDVGCETAIISSFILCEMAFPSRIINQSFWRINAATSESFSHALSKGDFKTFGDNIVSVSANIMRPDFLQLLKQTGSEFPVFDCGGSENHVRYISYVYVCDYIDHCRNRRDENVCMLEPQTGRQDNEEHTQICKGAYCCDGSCLPLQWVNDGEIDCFICGYGINENINDESEVIINYLNSNETCAFICKSNDEDRDKCVHYSQLNNGVVDCKGPEGPLDETIGKLETAETCNNILGHRIWAPNCVFVRDRLGAILGCRDLSHLSECADFVCPAGYFKCPKTYCIPQHYVLDGLVDCPSGEEEQIDIIGKCSGNFACWDSKMCLHPDLVCNGHPDCPHGDDEVDCQVQCPKGFRCVSGTITVSDYNKSIPIKRLYPIDQRIKYIDLSGVDLSVLDNTSLSLLQNVVVVIMSQCKLDHFNSRYFYLIKRVWKFDLSYNLFEIIDGSYMNYSPLENIRHLNLAYNKALIVVKYLQLTFLETLDLSHTGLSDIDESFLVGLPNLKYLNLSFTFITGFSNNVFPSGLNLITLDLRDIQIMNFYEDFFNGLTISYYLYTDSFELCCPQIRGVRIPPYTCHAPEITISSCFDLVGATVQRVLLWVVAVLAVIGNLTVVVYRVIWDRPTLRTGYGLFVTNLGISDFLKGVYLFIIAGADYYYRDIYVLYDKTWRESIACKLAGFLVVFSSQSSILFIGLLTLDRFLVMKFPFGQMKFSTEGKTISLLLSWILSFVVALVPIVLNFELHSSSAMCIGLPLATERQHGWKYSLGVFIMMNFVICLIVVYGQRAIFQAMSENRITGTGFCTSPRRAEDIKVAKRLSLVAVSNLVCWFPVGCMCLLSIGEQKVSNDVYVWIILIVLLISSAGNPLMFTICGLMEKLIKFIFDETKSCSTSTACVVSER